MSKCIICLIDIKRKDCKGCGMGFCNECSKIELIGPAGYRYGKYNINTDQYIHGYFCSIRCATNMVHFVDHFNDGQINYILKNTQQTQFDMIERNVTTKYIHEHMINDLVNICISFLFTE